MTSAELYLAERPNGRAFRANGLSFWADMRPHGLISRFAVMSVAACRGVMCPVNQHYPGSVNKQDSIL